MKYSILIFVFFLLGLTHNILAQRCVFTEISDDTAAISYKNIAILGAGTVENRAFLDFLTDKIIAKLKDKKVINKFEYLGNNVVEAKKKIPGYFLQSFDAILTFTPADSLPNISQRASTYTFPTPAYPTPLNTGPIQMTTIYTRKNKMITCFVVKMFDKNDQTKSIWEATLSIKSDTKRGELYTTAANELIKSWKKYHIIE